MADNVAVTVDGARQLRSAMKRAGEDLTQMRDANLATASIVSQASRGTAPRRTGLLASSVRPGATRTQAIVRAGSAGVPYAGVIHWGWQRRHIRAQPWVSIAAQRTEGTWVRVYETAVRKIIDKVGSRV